LQKNILPTEKLRQQLKLVETQILVQARKGLKMHSEWQNVLPTP
jgi:hypothetical protein